MLHFLKKWHYYYKQDKEARACTEVNGKNFINAINNCESDKSNKLKKHLSQKNWLDFSEEGETEWTPLSPNKH